MNEKEIDRLFYALSDGTRRGILTLLSTNEEMTFGELVEHFDSSKQAISKHVMVLEEAGFLKKERSGRICRCRFGPAPLEQVVDVVSQYKKFWEERINKLDDYLDRMK